MNLKIIEIWRRIRSSFWFLPSLMAVGAIGLAFSGLYLDRLLEVSTPAAWPDAPDLESARGLLSTIASSMITVAGVTFSVVIVALTLASSQYGPRLLTRFMDDTGNQVVLGTFVSVFLYCVIVLLHLPGSAEDHSSPRVSVLIGVVLSVIAVGVLIYFFHHISTSIQAEVLVQDAGRALDLIIAAQLPDSVSETDRPWPPKGFSEANALLRSPRSGYVNALDIQRLLEVANRHDLRLVFEARVGDFILRDQVLAKASPAVALTAEISAEIYDAMSILPIREGGEDLLLAVERLTEIAVRGLSPGINDPYTAISSIHRLIIALDDIMDRLEESSVFGEGEGRIFLRGYSAEELFALALGPIRNYGRSDFRVLKTMVDGLSSLARPHRSRWAPLLRKELKLISETGRDHLATADECASIQALCGRAGESLEAGTGAPA